MPLSFTPPPSSPFLQVPLAQLEGETAKWCRRILQNSPTAIACLKAALNADEDGAAGVQVDRLLGNAIDVDV